MDSKKAEALLKKYWEGKTNQDEEKALKSYFSSSKSDEALPSDYFRYLKEKSIQNPLGSEFEDEMLHMIEEDISGSRPKTSILKYWYIAASLAIIVSVSIIFKNRIFNVEDQPQVMQVDTFEDPELAFEETKKALLFLSSNDFKGSLYYIQNEKISNNPINRLYWNFSQCSK